MNKSDKPKLDINGQISHLQSKGVLFEKISVEEATAYLKDNNNYFKLRAFRKNFPKHPDGENKGKYIRLDFAALKDLSIIDMRMRYIFIQMALDIEHFAKVRLIQAVVDSDDDGYQIVEDYFNSLRSDDEKNKANGKETHFYDALKSDIDKNKDNPYCGGLIAKYHDCYPIWVFVEIIPLGKFINFYKFCAEKLCCKQLEDEYYLLLDIREIRNAAAHSNCIINDLGAKNQKHKPNMKMIRALKDISKTSRDTQLSNERMRQMITLLYAHTVFVTSSGVRSRTKDLLTILIDRIYRNISLYEGHENILKSFSFLKKTIDILFPNE